MMGAEFWDFHRLGLPLAGRSVLAIGSEPTLAEHLRGMGCSVAQIDVVDADRDEVVHCGPVDVVVCWGATDRLLDPFALLRNVGEICESFAVIEAGIIDSNEAVARLVREPLDGRWSGSRQSPAYLELAARSGGFLHLYAPLEVPDRPEFDFEWRNDGQSFRGGRELRDILIVSKQPLESVALLPR